MLLLPSFIYLGSDVRGSEHTPDTPWNGCSGENPVDCLNVIMHGQLSLMRSLCKTEILLYVLSDSAYVYKKINFRNYTYSLLALIYMRMLPEVALNKICLTALLIKLP